MKTAVALAALLAVAPAARAEEAKAETKPAKADLQVTLYAIGQVVEQQLASFDLSKEEFETVLKGLKEAHAGKPKQVLTTQHQADINKLAGDRMSAKMARTAGPYLAKAAAEKGAVKTDSGLIYLALSEGTGASPAATDKVKVHYTGKLTDGKVFDSSVQRGKPVEFPLNGVIPCWTEGVQKMKVGGKARLVCPAAIAYGDRGAGQAIPPGATLDFEVELIEIVK